MITKHGPSKNTSQSDFDTTLFGVGQGATDASAVWLLISTILSRLYNNQAHECTVVSPDERIQYNWSHAMFVDDATLIHTNNNTQATNKELCEMVQQDIKVWNDGLHVSGGYLNG